MCPLYFAESRKSTSTCMRAIIMQWETAKTFCYTCVHDKERCSPHLPRVFDTLSQFEACICKKYSFSLPPLAVQIAVDIQPPDFFSRRRSQVITGHFTMLPLHMARTTTRRNQGHLEDSAAVRRKIFTPVYTYDLFTIYTRTIIQLCIGWSSQSR